MVSPRKASVQNCSVEIPDNIGVDLVELVRRNTNLSYDLSRVAVGTVLGTVKEQVPLIAGVMEEIMKNLVQNKVKNHTQNVILH